MKSPITGKEMKLATEITTLPYRKIDFSVIYHYYLCEDTGERFTDDDLDEINQIQVYNQYRERFRIPFPEEITRIRQKYSVTASKMSEILGLGVNTYRLYENGEMPSVANGRLILSVNEPDEFIRQIHASSHILSNKETEKHLAAACLFKKKEKEHFWDLIFEDHIFNNKIPNEFSGYKEPNLNKVSQLISFYDNKVELWKTKLNKLLFYADFCAYKNTGYSITGITYRAIPYGPVPAEYEKMYIKLCDDQKLDLIQVAVGNGNYGELIKSKERFDDCLFTKDELFILNEIVSVLSTKTTQEIVNLSHLEDAWVENEKTRSNISYQKYAYTIKGVLA